MSAIPKYDDEILEIVDTDRFITISKNMDQHAVRKAAGKFGLYAVKIYKCMYIRSEPNQRRKILSTLM